VNEKGQSFKKYFMNIIVAIKEHIRVFLLGLACKKKCIFGGANSFPSCLDGIHCRKWLLENDRNEKVK
jgi:hypothetical protein